MKIELYKSLRWWREVMELKEAVEKSWDWRMSFDEVMRLMLKMRVEIKESKLSSMIWFESRSFHHLNIIDFDPELDEMKLQGLYLL